MSHRGFALLTLSFLYHEAMDFPVCEVNKAVHLSYHSPALTVNYDPKTLPTPYFETTETPTLPTICPFPDGFLKIIGFSSISSSDSGHYCHCWMQTAGLQTNGSGVSFTFTVFHTFHTDLFSPCRVLHCRSRVLPVLVELQEFLYLPLLMNLG